MSGSGFFEYTLCVTHSSKKPILEFGSDNSIGPGSQYSFTTMSQCLSDQWESEFVVNNDDEIRLSPLFLIFLIMSLPNLNGLFIGT